MARMKPWIVVALLVAACATPVSAPDGSGIPTRSALPQAGDRIHQQANDALVRWADAVRASGGASITFLGELTSQIGSWEDEVGANNGDALDAGAIETSTPLAEERPGRREVKWVDGSKVDVDVLSARQAFDELIASSSADCDGCEPLHVTDANLANGLVETSSGPAEVPMWVYSIRDSAVRVTRVAVDDSVTVDPPPWDAEDPPAGLSIEGATGTPGSRELEVRFVGGAEDCGAEYAAEAVESELAVVVIVTEEDSGDCQTLQGALRTLTVELDAKLGERVVLEVRQGLPVPVTP